MKKINQFLISVILTALLINPVYGFPGMAGNSSAAETGDFLQSEQEIPDLSNATQSDQNIILLQHLIEVDAAQFESQNRIYVRETLIYKNIGDKNFSGTLRTWVPDGVEGLKAGKVAMMMGGSVIPINAVQEGNIISWQDYIRSNDPLPPLYAVEYMISSEAGGPLVKSRHFSKKFVFPTLINKVPVSFILKVTRGSGENIVIRDEKGSSISLSGQPLDEDNSVLYNWESPTFREINIELSKSMVDVSQIALYLIIGLLIVLILAYPIIRKKSPKIREIEEKIRNSLKREPESEEQQAEIKEITEEEPEDEVKEENEEIPQETSKQEWKEQKAAPEEEEISGKTTDELAAEKNELTSKLDQLEKDYASGNLIDEEYEELKNSYQQKLKNINRRIE